MEKDYYMNLVPFFDTYLGLKYNRTVKGTENIPYTPGIFAINHLHIDDSLIVAAEYARETGNPLRFAAKSEYYDAEHGINGKGLLGPQVKWFMEHTHQIPVYREDSTRAYPFLERGVLAALRNGDSVALHPEGTRSLDGRLNKFRPGVARIAIQGVAKPYDLGGLADVPIIPTGIIYTNMPGLRRTHVSTEFGEPIYTRDFVRMAGRTASRATVAAALTEVLENRVAALTGQERSGIVAPLPSQRATESE